MDLKKLSNSDLTSSFEQCVGSERKITAEVLQHIAEIDRRRLFVEKGFTSLFDYLVKELGYSPGAAMRRIDAARLIHEIPEVMSKFEMGLLTLSQASQVQKASRDLKKMKNTPFTAQDKRELFLQIENQNQKETEKIIAKSLNLPVPSVEKHTFHHDQSVTLTLTFTQGQMEILEKAQEMVAHTGAGNKWAETITYLAKKEIARRTNSRSAKDQKVASNPPLLRTSTSVADLAPSGFPLHSKNSRSRHIAQPLRKKLLHPDAACAYKDHSGKPCNSRRFLQIDHIKSWSLGGTNTLDNLQVLCGVHNRLKYKLEKSFRNPDAADGILPLNE